MDSSYSSTLAEEGLAATFPVSFAQFEGAHPASRCVDIKVCRIITGFVF
jgi:hypothetical protein